MDRGELQGLRDAEDRLREAREVVEAKRAEMIDLLNERSEIQWRLNLLKTYAGELGRRLAVQNTRAAQTDAVGIRLDSTCQALIRLGDNASCPSYAALLSMDDAIDPHTGPLVWDPAANDLRRDAAPVKFPSRLYRNTTVPHTVLDPPASLHGEIRTLWITPEVRPTSPTTTNIDLTWDRPVRTCLLYTSPSPRD